MVTGSSDFSALIAMQAPGWCQGLPCTPPGGQAGLWPDDRQQCPSPLFLRKGAEPQCQSTATLPINQGFRVPGAILATAWQRPCSVCRPPVCLQCWSYPAWGEVGRGRGEHCGQLGPHLALEPSRGPRCCISAQGRGCYQLELVLFVSLPIFNFKKSRRRLD